MITAMIIVFIVGYLAIALEHQININKTATAMMTGVLCWSIFILMSDDISLAANTHYQAFIKNNTALTTPYIGFINFSLKEALASTAEILFFLMAAMTIVELIDAHEGFTVVTSRITTRNSRTLLWVISIITFFLSALLDNLTTAIVMVSLVRKLVEEREKRLLYAAVVIVAANAGGAWSPIGDVTTTMLWMKGQISAINIIFAVILPSIVSVLVPVIYFNFQIKGDLKPLKKSIIDDDREYTSTKLASIIMLMVGIGALIFVPIFKNVTHLPPYMGMVIGLSVVWIVSELINSEKDAVLKHPLSAVHALSRIDTSSVLFFLGILIAIGALETTGILHHFADAMSKALGNIDIVVVAVGIMSAIIDNVPLVAATQGMYSLTEYPTDSKLWHFLAYCAGTGGSILIIGSAAGIAVMGMEKIEFGWYMKKISLIVLLGYLAGAGVYLLQYGFTH